MSQAIVKQLRQSAPFSEDGGLMVRAADALEGSGTPAFVSLVGVPDGPIQMRDATRDALLAAGWASPELVERLQDEAWDSGYKNGIGDAA